MDFKLVLDIDECLISSHSLDEEIVGDLNYFQFENEIIIERPFLSKFLKYCFNNFEVSFSTRMTKDRCDFILNKILKKKQIPKEVFTREDCYEYLPPYGSKEVRKNSFEENVIWVDDSPEYIDLNLEFVQKVIKIGPFDGDIVDDELRSVIRHLKTLKK